MIILRPQGDALVMHQLLFHAEVRPVSDIGALPNEVREGELKLARQLIEQQAAEAFEPSQYVDEVHQRIEAAIRKKVEGHEIALSEPPRPSASNVIDLTAALKASLSGRNEAKLGPRKPAKRVERRTSARRSSRG
jgi:DNA end-binding protein Ku